MNESILVYGDAKPKSIELPEGFELAGTVVTAPNRLALVAVNSEGVIALYYVQKGGIKWTLGPIAKEPYEPKTIKETVTRSEPTIVCGQSDQGSDTRSTRSRKSRARRGADGQAEKSADNAATGSED